MADLTRTIEIIFGAVDDGVQQTTEALDRALGSLSGSVPAVAGALAGVADKALAAETAIIALATVYGGIALRTASEFQAAQVTLGRIIGDAPGQLDALKTQVESLALTYGQSSTTVYQFATDFLQAGYSAEEAGQLTKDALDLMVAGDISADAATQVIIGTMRGFGATVSEIPAILDGLNAVVDGTATNLDQLSEGMKIAAPVARALGFTWQETTAILTPIIEIFQDGSEAGTAFATSMGRLIDDSAPVKEALRDLGVSQTDLNGHMRNGRDIFFDVQRAFQGLDSTQQLFYANQLVGVEQGKRLVLAFGDLNRTQEILNITQQSTGSIAREVGLQLQTMEAQANRVAEGFRQMNAAVGAQLAENLGGISSGLVDLEVAFRRVVESGGLDPLFDALGEQAVRIGEILSEVARNLPDAFEHVDFSGLLRSFSNLSDQIGDLFEGLFGDIDINTPEGLARALQSLVDAFTALNNVVAGIADEFTPVFAALGEMISRSGDAGEEAQIMAGKFLGAARLVTDLGEAIGGLAIFLEESGADIEAFGDTVEGIFRVVTNTLGALFNGFQVIIFDTLEAIVGGLEAVTPDALGDPFKQALNDLRTLSHSFGQDFNANLDGIVEGFGQIGNGAADLVDSTVAAAQGLDDVGESGAAAVDATNDFEPIDLGDIDFVAEGMKRLGINAQDAATATDHAASAQDRLASASKTETLATGYTKFTDALGDVHYAFASAEEKALGYKKVVDDLGNVSYIQVGNAIDRTNKALEDQTKKVDDATKKAQEFDLKLREIQSKERIAIIEGKFRVDEAAIEADAERVAAAFESINTAIESTGETITDLFGLMGRTTDEFDKLAIMDAIREEQRRREETFKLQQKLTEEEIRYLKARTQRITAGESLIKVEAANITPALERIFDEILKMAQVRANEEGLELLLGV